MQFYFLMAIATACTGIYFQDFSWLLLALGSTCLGLGKRISYGLNDSNSDNNNHSESEQGKSSKSGFYSRIGFLIIASALLVNALSGGLGS